jgi:hypothetical protein
MRIPRSTGAVSAILIVLLGVWGALIPFVGPYFDYSFGVNSTWHYTSDRLWLCIVPGAVAVVAGLLLLTAATRTAGIVGGWLAVLAGGWFAIGPAVSRTWERGAGPIGAPLYGTTRQALELIGYFYGLGALIVALGAFAIGRFTSRPAIAAEPVPATRRPVAAEPAVAGGPVPAGAGAREPIARQPVAAAGAPPVEGRRRGLLRRRRSLARSGAREGEGLER